MRPLRIMAVGHLILSYIFFRTGADLASGATFFVGSACLFFYVCVGVDRMNPAVEYSPAELKNIDAAAIVLAMVMGLIMAWTTLDLARRGHPWVAALALAAAAFYVWCGFLVGTGVPEEDGA